MTAPKMSIAKFLSRWSRRKLAAESAGDTASDEGAPAFDPASLPPIESIQAATDVRVFLAAGVPRELSRAALRRAWVADPTIRDFIGIAENQWDFTKPDGIPGFGPLALTPDLRRLISDLIDDDPHRGLMLHADRAVVGASKNVGVGALRQRRNEPEAPPRTARGKPG
jgi:Protein of unknown function (DUF3306)